MDTTAATPLSTHSVLSGGECDIDHLYSTCGGSSSLSVQASGLECPQGERFREQKMDSRNVIVFLRDGHNFGKKLLKHNTILYVPTFCCDTHHSNPRPCPCAWGIAPRRRASCSRWRVPGLWGGTHMNTSQIRKIRKEAKNATYKLTKNTETFLKQ